MIWGVFTTITGGGYAEPCGPRQKVTILQKTGLLAHYHAYKQIWLMDIKDERYLAAELNTA
ncbi:MAG TPA: hypothetical protein VHB48_17880, partial [Chitinophagaceae bacterium]|nr:hypothetical protein [Chitinophagaceae bacterium]